MIEAKAIEERFEFRKEVRTSYDQVRSNQVNEK
jgi:hypothetical protein